MHDQSGTTGELEVVGSGSISIRLRTKPRHVKVFFRGTQTLIPCDMALDITDWKVDEKSNRHGRSIDLVISWVVSGTRMVEWEVIY